MSMISAKVVVIPLNSTSPPPLAEEKAQNQFYAKLAEDSEQVVKNIVGMSGGPVFMLKYVDETWKYNLIGVQSGWYPESRIIAACPFTTFGEALEPFVREARLLAQQSGAVA